MTGRPGTSTRTASTQPANGWPASSSGGRFSRAVASRVCVDSAPVLGISDTRLAVRLADTVLLAIQWGKTNYEVALNGLEALFESHADVAGAVLTQVDLRCHAKYGFGDMAQSYGKFKKYYID